MCILTSSKTLVLWFLYLEMIHLEVEFLNFFEEYFITFAGSLQISVSQEESFLLNVLEKVTHYSLTRLLTDTNVKLQ